MSDWNHDEKEEKQEKEEEKQEKNEWERDRLSALTWAAILIWAGLVLLADSLGILVIAEAWPIILLGAGGILLLEIAARLVMPEYRRPIGGQFVLAVILIAVGLGNWLDSDLIWPIALILIGLGILGRNLFKPKE